MDTVTSKALDAATQQISNKRAKLLESLRDLDEAENHLEFIRCCPVRLSTMVSDSRCDSCDSRPRCWYEASLAHYVADLQDQLDKAEEALSTANNRLGGLTFGKYSRVTTLTLIVESLKTAIAAHG